MLDGLKVKPRSALELKLRRYGKIEGYETRWYEAVAYLPEEAKERGIEYCYWKDVRAPGWVLTDDGYVVVAHSVRQLSGPKVGKNGVPPWRVTTCGCGDQITSPRSMLLWSKTAQKNYGYNRHWIRQKLRTSSFKQMIRSYVTMRLDFLGGGKVDWYKLGMMVAPKDKHPDWKAKLLIRQPEVQEVIGQEIEKKISTSKVTVDRVLEELDQFLTAAKKKEDLDNLKEMLFKLMDMHGMLPEKRKVSFSFNQNVAATALPETQEFDEIESGFKAAQLPEDTGKVN